MIGLGFLTALCFLSEHRDPVDQMHPSTSCSGLGFPHLVLEREANRVLQDLEYLVDSMQHLHTYRSV